MFSQMGFKQQLAIIVPRDRSFAAFPACLFDDDDYGDDDDDYDYDYDYCYDDNNNNYYYY